MSATLLDQPTATIQPASKPGWFFPACLAASFVIALALRLWFNFYGSHMNAYAMGDAYEYLSNARALQAYLANPQTTPLSSLGGFAISGPIYPIVLLISFVVTGHAVDVSNWQIPIVAQCFLTSLTCIFVGLATAKAWDRTIGGTAAILTAIYPAFIVNSGRLYTENLACLLIAILCYLVINVITSERSSWERRLPAGQQSWERWLPAGSLSFAAIGITLAVLQLTRSVMFLLAPIMLFATVASVPRPQRLKLGAILTTCYILTLLPWMAFGKAVWGSASPIVDRVGHYNFLVGNDVDAQGFLGFPYPDVNGIEQRSLLTLGKEAFRRSPSRFLSLNLDKPARLLKFPWNDFRASIGPVTQFAQVAVHQLLLLLAALGFLVSLCLGFPKQPSGRQLASRLVITSVAAIQITYLLFITIPRYNLTVMPILLIFAAAGLITIIRTAQSATTRRASLVVAAACVLLFVAERVPGTLITSCIINALALAAILFATFKFIDKLHGYKRTAKIAAAILAICLIPSLCLPIRAHGRWYEKSVALSDSTPQATETISLPASTVGRQLYLAVDSDGWKPLMGSLKFQVNGHELNGPVIPQLPLLQDLHHPAVRNGESIWDFEWVFNCLTRVGGICNGDVRQWYLIPIPSNFVTGSQVVINASAAPGTTATLFSSSNTRGNKISIPSFSKASYEKAFYGVENDNGLNDSRFDQHLTVLGLPQPSHLNLRILNSPGSAGILPAFTQRVPTYQLNPTQPQTLAIPGSHLPTFSPSDTWLIRLTGKVRSTSGVAKPGITFALKAKDNKGTPITYSSPWTPSIMQAGTTPTTFDIAFPLVPSAIGRSIDSLQTTFYADSPINHPVSEKSGVKPAKPDVTFESVAIEISRVDKLPAAPFEVY